MKALVSLVLVAAMIGGVYLLSTGGCKAQTQVAGDKLMAKINSWLGELDVKRKEISNQIDNLDKAVEKVRRNKIEAEVQLEEYQKKIDPIKKKISQIKEALALLQPHVKATEDVEINGKTWSPDKVRDNINALIDEYEALNQKLGGLEVSVKAFQQSYNLLATQQASADKTMKMLGEKLAEIDAKKEALDSMKTAQTILGEGGSISDEFNKLEKDINELFVDVESGMRLESEKIAERERDLATSTSAVDDVLKQMESADETASRLEAILGPGAADTPDK
jgi:chromosome segregation ATPase